jgi:hypothetical protein
MSDLDAAQSPAISKPPILTLPPKVRGMIFAYLLDARYTRLQRLTRTDPAYKFHTNILLVSRSIRSDAERYLYEHNTFVTASHILDDADAFITALHLWVPLVSWKYRVNNGGSRLHYATTMKYNSLQVSLAYRSGGLARRLGSGFPPQGRSCTFLAADLISYCSVLSSHLGDIQGPELSLLAANNIQVVSTVIA